jgi:NAD(P)-dependent dehydrogenase (short-subunit alcohol dehydrogenase family)
MDNSTDLRDKVALVTGATSGLGEATARQLAGRGAQVVMCGRREEMGLAVERSIKEAGGNATFIRADVTERAEIEALIDRTMGSFGRLDCAVNNAGVLGPALTPIADVEEAQWDEVMNTNLRGLWLCMKFEIPAMLQGGSGSIVNLSSIYGIKGSEVGHGPYSATKHAVIGLTRSAAIDYGGQGLRINAVAPGFSHSEIVDGFMEQAPDLTNALVARHSTQNRVAESAEQAAAITWLCSDSASYVNGAVLVVDGGPTTRLY